MLVKRGLQKVKKLNDLAKDINILLLENDTIREYLSLKEEIEDDKELLNSRNKLDVLRKKICKNKEEDSEQYFIMLDEYNNDYRIKRFNALKKEINEYFIELSDILSLK